MTEAWIVDVTTRVGEVALEPTGDGYEGVHQFGMDATVSPAALRVRRGGSRRRRA